MIVDFFYSNFTQETDGPKFASTITLVFQANQLTKCASQFIISLPLLLEILGNMSIVTNCFPVDDEVLKSTLALLLIQLIEAYKCTNTIQASSSLKRK